MKVYTLICAILACLILSCTKESDTTTIIEDELTFTAPTNIEGDLFIHVTNYPSGQSSDIVSCEMNGVVYTADPYGIILVENVLMKEQGQYVTISRAGYFDEVRYVLPRLGERTNLQVAPRKLQNPKTFAANEDVVISTNNVAISIPANTIIQDDGSVYTGLVTYFYYPIQNALYASETRTHDGGYISTAQYPTSAVTLLGGLQLILHDDLGNQLSIDQTSDITLDIEIVPVETNPSYPDSFDILKYDGEIQSYESISKARIENSTWTAIVHQLDHLIWGVTNQTRVGEVTVVDDMGSAIEDAIVMLFTDQENPVSIAFTNGDGLARMPIPLQQPFTLRTSFLCTPTPLVWQEYDALPLFNAEPLTIDPFEMPAGYFYEAVGTLVDCAGLPISYGLVEIPEQLADRTVLTDAEGRFRLSLTTCKDEHTVTATDRSTGMTSDPIMLSAPAASVQIQLGDITVCN